MAIKVGISGFGRISRLAIRSSLDMPDIEIAGINYRNADLDYLVYMLKYDSVFGRFPGELGTYEGGIVINGKEIPVVSERQYDGMKGYFKLLQMGHKRALRLPAR